MILKKIKKDFNNSSDLKHKKINNVNLVYLESVCSSVKLNDFIMMNLAMKDRYLNLRDNISGPCVVYIEDVSQVNFYLLNGFALVYDDKDMLVCEVKGDLFRSVNIPTTEPSVNGPKDSFNESILMNLGLIKRRIKSEKLYNEDFELGRKTKTKVSILYIDDIAKKKHVNLVRKKINKIDIDGLIDIEILMNILNDKKSPFPTIMKTERPDKVSSALLEGKVVLLADNSPYALILPVFLADFINPESDKYVKSLNVNFLKLVRLFCFCLTIFLPALYIAIINFNPETIPLKLLLSFQSGRSGVPFPSSFEAIFMIFLCIVLRESDIRFPSAYGSSISILGALILGEAAVSANIASPIMIIIVGITFVTGLVFSSGEVISGLRDYRLLLLILASLFGLYGLVIGFFILIISLCDTKSFGEPYLYPIAPFDKTYVFKTLFKARDKKRSKLLSKNIIKVRS